MYVLGSQFNLFGFLGRSDNPISFCRCFWSVVVLDMLFIAAPVSEAENSVCLPYDDRKIKLI